MALYLVLEGTWAVGIMSIVFTVALLGVAALGWYVIRCDVANRHAERDLLAPEGHHASGAESRPPAVHTVPATVGESPAVTGPVLGAAEAPAVEPAPAALVTPPTPPHRPRRKH